MNSVDLEETSSKLFIRIIGITIILWIGLHLALVAHVKLTPTLVGYLLRSHWTILVFIAFLMAFWVSVYSQQISDALNIKSSSNSSSFVRSVHIFKLSSLKAKIFICILCIYFMIFGSTSSALLSIVFATYTYIELMWCYYILLMLLFVLYLKKVFGVWAYQMSFSCEEITC